jgi:hypothetical protein
MRTILCVISLFVFLSTAEAAYLDIAWIPNGESDLAGYRVYYGTESGDYINFVDVGMATSCHLDDLLEDVTYYISLTAYDIAGNESGFSNEVSGIGFAEEPGVGVSDETGTDAVWEKSGGCFVSDLLTAT